MCDSRQNGHFCCDEQLKGRIKPSELFLVVPLEIILILLKKLATMVYPLHNPFMQRRKNINPDYELSSGCPWDMNLQTHECFQFV